MTNDELQMTNWPADECLECSPGEIAFWGFEPADSRELLVEEDAPPSPVNNRLVDQLVGAGTSVGANYCEADDGVSRADFKHRIGICRKEARETKFFLRMVATSEPSLKAEARELWKEGHALHRIFSRIWRSTKL